LIRPCVMGIRLTVFFITLINVNQSISLNRILPRLDRPRRDFSAQSDGVHWLVFLEPR
jgi:hypothetical protein